jgi:hypothetical protein
MTNFTSTNLNKAAAEALLNIDSIIDKMNSNGKVNKIWIYFLL